MAEGDSEVVFGKGRSAIPEAHSFVGVNLFGHGDVDDTTDLETHIDQATLQGSTPRGEGNTMPDSGVRHVQNSKLETRERSPALAKMVVRPETYDGKVDWSEYFSHFSDCAELGGWDNRAKCLVLAANLRGAARKYYTGLTLDEKKDYDRLTAALRRRFGGEHRQDSWLSRLEMRKRKSGESISELGDDIWQMSQRAYYDFDHRSQEQLALKHFYRVIDADMKVKCVENKCANLADAVDVVERYEALYEDRKEVKRAALRAIEPIPDATATALERVMARLEDMEIRQVKSEKQLASKAVHFSQDQRRTRMDRTCYGCGEAGHFIANCPQQPNAYPSNMNRNSSYKARQNGHQTAQGNANPSN